jgi:ABC-type antimicrobial peptide transport system, ATPase component
MIVLENLRKEYVSQNGREHTLVLNDINLTISDGDFVSIVGPSGSGKSSLINIIGTLDREYEGNYLIGGSSLTSLSDKKVSRFRQENIGFIFQNFKLLPQYTVAENIRFPSIYSKSGIASEEKIRNLLKIVDLADKYYEYPNNLSGGQQQRIAIARSMINNPSIIIADEPTGALDSKMSKKILGILQDINHAGKTIIMVTHSEMAANVANKKIEIIDGILTEI